jgi:putative redox protein
MGEIAHTTYLGKLRTVSKHLKSGHEIVSDAPVDNHGEGERFSPTDAMATSLTTCMLTVMGIAAQKNDFSLNQVEATTAKTMGVNPRRIVALKVDVEIRVEEDWPAHAKQLLEKAAKDCPVAMSLHPEIRQEVRFEYFT